MNKKILVSIALVAVLFLTGLLGFVIIPNALNKFKVASAMSNNATFSVSGNGSGAVMVGEYLYFVNGFTSKESYKYKQNEHNKVREAGDGGIWRVIMPNGAPTFDNKYLTDFLAENDFTDWEFVMEHGMNSEIDHAKNFVVADKTDGKNNLELVVPKIAGWENTSIWVMSDGNNEWLIYTTPNNQKNRRGELQRDRIDFFQCNLRGGNHKKIYTTHTDSVTKDDFTVAWAGGKPHLIVKDGDRLVHVSMSGGAHTISSTVTSVVFPVVSAYFGNIAENYSGVMGNVYYTESATEDDVQTGNKLFRFNIAENKKYLINHSHNTHQLLALGNGHLIFKTDFSRTDVARGTEMYITDRENLDNLSQQTYKPFSDRESKVFLSSERNLGAFRVITHDGANFRSYEITNADLNKIPNTYKTIQGDASKVTVTDNKLITLVNGTVITHNYITGEQDIYGIHALNSQTSGLASEGCVSVFEILDNMGKRTGKYSVFFIRDVTEINDHDDHGHAEGEECTDENILETVKVASFLRIDGNAEYMIAKLDTDKFVKFPTKPDTEE